MAAAERIRRPDGRHAQPGADQIAAGPTPGILYAPTRRGGSSRWCGQVLLDMTEMEEARARQIVGQWRSGLLHGPLSTIPTCAAACRACGEDNAKRPTE